MQWSYRCGPATLLQELPVGLQFCLVQFSPSLNQSVLAQRKRTGDLRNRRDGVNGGVFLIISMEVRRVVALARFGKHADDDAIKA